MKALMNEEIKVDEKLNRLNRKKKKRWRPYRKRKEHEENWKERMQNGNKEELKVNNKRK